MNMQKIVSHRLHLPEAARIAGPALLKQGWLKLRRWHELARQRRQLASLSDEMLRTSAAVVPTSSGRPAGRSGMNRARAELNGPAAASVSPTTG